MRFADPKSRKQIAQYRLHELHAARWRNCRNLERWTEHLRSEWELRHIGSAKPAQPLDLDDAQPGLVRVGVPGWGSI